ncbi:MAG: patatin [Paludibacter sp.]|nr:patatin [Paludibacter sp.]
MARKSILLFTLILIISNALWSQKVGLVLSGGGAKGITHIGIIKALEENNIPIDYITGTSMGAIVGGMYAMGYTPDEMIKLFKSNDFRHWSTGEIESNYVYYYRNSDSKPSFIEIPFKLKGLDSLNFKTSLLPTNLIPSGQMNYAFFSLCAQANAAADGDFNKLMVPFRCVASDIYNKEAVVFSHGVLGDAIRASMTFPFMFKPIMIDNRLLFDGGIFNNFPVDVMRKDFNPDFMIGSVVSNNPKKPNERDIIMQIENMIMNKTDFSIGKDEGLLLKFETENIGTFAFSNVDELVKMGYDSTIMHMDEIKKKISRTVSNVELDNKRKTFINSFPEFKFQNVIVEGVDSLQKKYVEQTFHYYNKIFDLNDCKEAYFKLISDEKIMEVIPHAIFNKNSGFFDLNVNVKIQDHLKVSIGGNISSSTSNQAYLGITYQNVTEYSQTAYIDAQFGRMYNGLGLGARIEIPTQKSWYTKLAIVFHKFDYFEGNQVFYADDRTANFTQYETYSKLSIGFPLTMKGRLEFGIGYGLLTDYYIQDRSLISSATKSDKSIFSLGNLFGRLETYTLNGIMYPTKGYNHFISLQLLGGEERFKSSNQPENNNTEIADIWVQLRTKFDHYYPISSRITLGTYGELAISTRNFQSNYTVSLIQAPSFQPTPHSKTVFNGAYSANQFIAVGLKPIYHINRQLQLRGEAYYFLPYQNITRANNNSAYYSPPFTSSHFIGEASFVYDFRIATAGVFMNYYSSAASKWNFGVNIGVLLFNNKFID